MNNEPINDEVAHQGEESSDFVDLGSVREETKGSINGFWYDGGSGRFYAA